jgi:hypothetical protein
MDAFLVSKLVNYKKNSDKLTEHLGSKKEAMDPEVVANDNTVNNIGSLTFLLMLLINSYAAYLSWDCNTNNNYPLLLKVLFAFFAFMFGSLYMIYYVLFRFDTCNTFSKYDNNQ